MHDWTAQVIRDASERFLLIVVRDLLRASELRKGCRLQPSIEIGAHETFESLMTGQCAHRHGMYEPQLFARRMVGILVIQETDEISGSGLILEAMLRRLRWNHGECRRARH